MTKRESVRKCIVLVGWMATGDSRRDRCLCPTKTSCHLSAPLFSYQLDHRWASSDRLMCLMRPGTQQSRKRIPHQGAVWQAAGRHFRTSTRHVYELAASQARPLSHALPRSLARMGSASFSLHTFVMYLLPQRLSRLTFASSILKERRGAWSRQKGTAEGAEGGADSQQVYSGANVHLMALSIHEGSCLGCTHTMGRQHRARERPAPRCFGLPALC
ncbi:hypothetical protein V8E36_006786 [Tilletia maclaganii]